MRVSLAALLVLALPLTAAPAAASAATAPPAVSLGSVIPAPVEAHPGGPDFRLTAGTVIEAPASALDVARRLAEALRPATGYALPIVPHAPGGTPVISLATGPVGARLSLLVAANDGLHEFLERVVADTDRPALTETHSFKFAPMDGAVDRRRGTAECHRCLSWR